MGGLRARATTGAMVLAVAAALYGCAGPAALGPGRSAPDVVVLVVDTLRADHVGAYGYARPTTPRIDAFAATATRWERAYATAPWTVPSHASLFTGRYPFEHGAHTRRVGEGDDVDIFTSALPARHRTLAEALGKAGYRTGAFVANGAYLSPKFGLDQGFDVYESRRQTAAEVTARAVEWLEERGDRPFFLFVNYIDAHSPALLNVPQVLPDVPIDEEMERHERLVNKYLLEGEPVPEELLRKQVDAYDNAVASIDASIGELLDRIGRRASPAGTVVTILSDHGQYFGEHGLLSHSKDVYEEVLRVPLIIGGPTPGAGEVRTEPLSLVDVPGLILSRLPAALAERLSPSFPGRAPGDPLLAEIYYGGAPTRINRKMTVESARVRRVIWEPPWKYLQSSDGNNELYDVEADPGEQRNLVAEQPEVAARLEGVLSGYIARRGEAPEKPVRPRLNEEDRQKLRSLGYVGE